MLVEIARADGIATVTLNRPDKLNALNVEMREELVRLFTLLGQEKAIRAIILTGAGRGFCGSGDVTSMGDFTPESARDRLKLAHRMILAVANIEKPVIAAVRGPVAGIGWSLAMACDLVVASETTKFIQVFKNVGLAPDGGAIYFLTQLLGVQRAKEIVYSARPVPAAEALALGLATEVVADEQLEASALALAGRFAADPAFSFGVTKKLFKSMAVPSLEAFLDAEAWAQEACLMTADHREGVAAFLEKRRPQFGQHAPNQGEAP
ncbi:MAG: Enoyl-CoA hydratase [Rhodospirillales bacterium]|nr:Enoyl-CoA hydratase [Rhodospirillales bacterium]